jgi:hypothetical protein
VYCSGSHEQALVHGHWKRDDAELSYLNSPAILTMLMVAGFPAMDKHYISWTTLEPPQYCLDRMFVTADGVTISEQVQRCIEVSSCAPGAVLPYRTALQAFGLAF